MPAGQQMIQAINALLASSWSPEHIARLLHVYLHRDRKAPEQLKMYHGKGSGPFRSVKLLVQTFGGRVGPSVYLDCDWDAHVTRADLSTLIPPNAVPKLNPPPTPGSKGPLRVSTTLSAVQADTRVGYRFESRDKSGEFQRSCRMS